MCDDYLQQLNDVNTRGRVEVGERGRFGWGGVEEWGENADNCK